MPLDGRDRELAAGQEAGGLARQGGQVRLGEGGDQAVILVEVERSERVEAEQMPAKPSVEPRRCVIIGPVRPAAGRGCRWRRVIAAIVAAAALAEAEVEAAGRVARSSRLTPISRASERLTSAILTWSITCSGVAVLRRLMHLGVPGADDRPGRGGSASSTSAGAATVPVSSDHAVHRRGLDLGVGHRQPAASRRPSRYCCRPGHWPNRRCGRPGRWRRPWSRPAPCRRRRSGWPSAPGRRRSCRWRRRVGHRAVEPDHLAVADRQHDVVGRADRGAAGRRPAPERRPRGWRRGPRRSRCRPSRGA